MSWTRFTDSDVYTFPSDKGLECCGCSLRGDDEPWRCWTSVTEFEQHLQAHADAGQHVDVQDIIAAVRADMNESYMEGITE